MPHSINPKSTTDAFDPNFCFPVKDLENDWVKLTPFNVRLIKPISMRHPLIDENDRYRSSFN
jgi:hypothetical protein